MKLSSFLRGDPSRLDVTPPTPSPDRSGVAVAVIVKNEAAYLQDWLTFQAAAGVAEVLLYDDGSTDRTAEIARAFRRIPVTVIPWNMSVRLGGTGLLLEKQELAYAHAVTTAGHRFRWMAFIDSDEVIVPVDADSIGAALEPLEAHPNISLPWFMFGHAGQETRPKAPFPFAFDKRAGTHAGPLVNFKCIVDPCEVTQVRTHKFETRKKGAATVNDQGREARDYKARRDPDFRSAAALQLNHYFLRAREDFRAKVEAGDITSAPEQKVRAHRLTLAEMIEADPVEDRAALNFLERVGLGDPEAFRAFGASAG